MPARASLWYVGSMAISRAIGALGTPIFTRLLTPAEYGIYPLYSTWLGVISVFVTLEITGASMYRALQRHKDDTERFVGAALGLILTLFAFFSLIYELFGAFFNRFTGLSSAITRLMLLQILASEVIALYTARARFEYRYKTVAAINILTSLGIPALAIYLICAVGIRAEGRILASSLTLAIVALPLALRMLGNARSLYSREAWRYILVHSLPLLPHYFSMTLILKVGEITVSRIYGAVALGKFSVALSVGMSLTVVTGGVLSALSPWMLRRMRCGELQKIRELLLLLVRLVSLVTLAMLAVAPEITAVLASPTFRSALPAVYPIALSVIPTFLSAALMSGSVYFEKSGFSALPSIAAAALSTVLSLTLLPLVDYRYLGVFILLSYTLLAALNVLTFKKMAGEPPIKVGATAITFAITCAYGVLLFAVRNVIAARIILALPLVLPLVKVCKAGIERIRE